MRVYSEDEMKKTLQRYKKLKKLGQYYKILDLDTKDSITLSEIKKAWKAFAMKYHPDKLKDSPAGVEIFKIGNDAYELLSKRHKSSSTIPTTYSKKKSKKRRTTTSHASFEPKYDYYSEFKQLLADSKSVADLLHRKERFKKCIAEDLFTILTGEYPWEQSLFYRAMNISPEFFLELLESSAYFFHHSPYFAPFLSTAIHNKQFTPIHFLLISQISTQDRFQHLRQIIPFYWGILGLEIGNSLILRECANTMKKVKISNKSAVIDFFQQFKNLKSENTYLYYEQFVTFFKIKLIEQKDFDNQITNLYQKIKPIIAPFISESKESPVPPPPCSAPSQSEAATTNASQIQILSGFATLVFTLYQFELSRIFSSTFSTRNTSDSTSTAQGSTTPPRSPSTIGATQRFTFTPNSTDTTITSQSPNTNFSTLPRESKP